MPKHERKKRVQNNGNTIGKTLVEFLKVHRNRIFTILFFIFVVLAVLEIPYEPFNRLAPKSEAIFLLGSVDRSVIGTVDLTGKGGLSATNPLTLTVTIYVNESILNQSVKAVFLLPEGTYRYPILKNERGFPLTPLLLLVHEGDKWYGQMEVLYNQGGTYGVEIRVEGPKKDHPEIYFVTIVPVHSVVHISDEDVTVAAKTNALLLSLELVFLAFMSLELRVENNGNNRQTKAKNHNGENNVGIRRKKSLV